MTRTHDGVAPDTKRETSGVLSQIRVPTTLELEGPFGTALVHVEPGPRRKPEEPSEDAAAAISISQGLVLAIADGVGGRRYGAAASWLAVETLRDALLAADDLGGREAIMDAFDQADLAAHAAPHVGSTTLLAIEINQGMLRTYNAGDSEAVLVSGRGRVKLRTVSHSPVGYQVAAGLIDENEAIHHDLRHYITNVVGTGTMRIDVGPRAPLALHDTLVMGSDGLFDNITIDELSSIVCRGLLPEAADTLVDLVRRRMEHPSPGEPSKPDDLSMVLFRPRHS